MITKPTPEQAIALADAGRNDRVTAYLQESLDKIKSRLVTVTDPDAFRVMQGQAQAYQELIHLVSGETRGKR